MKSERVIIVSTYLVGVYMIQSERVLYASIYLVRERSTKEIFHLRTLYKNINSWKKRQDFLTFPSYITDARITSCQYAFYIDNGCYFTFIWQLYKHINSWKKRQDFLTFPSYITDARINLCH